jgi:two-component system, chemotaxis family, chemotaxis protein CheY
MRCTPFSSSFSSTRHSVVRPPPSTSSSPRRVLVVDDDEEVRELLVELLAHEGYEVSAACNGQQALTKVLIHWPDVVLLDLVMPVMSGWQFLDLRPAYPMLDDLPVIVTSAVDGAAGDGSLDVAAVVPKPFLLEAMLATVRRVAGPPARQACALHVPLGAEDSLVGAPRSER